MNPSAGPFPPIFRRTLNTRPSVVSAETLTPYRVESFGREQIEHHQAKSCIHEPFQQDQSPPGEEPIELHQSCSRIHDPSVGLIPPIFRRTLNTGPSVVSAETLTPYRAESSGKGPIEPRSNMGPRHANRDTI